MLEEDVNLPNDEKISSIKKDICKVGLSLVAFIIVSQICANGLVYLGVEYFPEIVKNSLFQLLVGTLPIYIIGLPLLLLLTKSIPFGKPIKTDIMTPKKFICLLIFSFGAMYISSIISSIINTVIGNLKGSEVVTSTTQIISASSIPARIVLVAIIGPIMEEIIFRKVILSKLLRCGEFIAILFSAIAFGLFHGNIAQLIYTFSIGLILAYITVKTGTIKYAIFIHVIVNLFGSVIIPLMSSIGDANKMVLATAIVGLFVLGCMIFAIVFFVLNINKIKLNKKENDYPIRQQCKLLFTNIGTISLIVLSIVLIVISTLY